MNFITTTQAANKWGITKDRVLKLAKSNRIPGVVQIGKRWMIPSDAIKPSDNRYKTNKNNTNTKFRYPTFEGLDIKDIYPPLTSIEKEITKMSEKLFSCEFVEAEKLHSKLLKEDLNRYEYITVLRAGCYIYIYLNKKDEFFKCYEKLTSELNSDIDRKEELGIILLEINLTAGLDNNSIKDFKLKPEYKYHESFMSHIAAVCAVSLNFSSTHELTEHDLLSYEFMCSSYEYKNCLVDLQTIHYYLGITYGLMNIKDKMTYHLKKSLDLAYEHNLYYTVCVGYTYVSKMIDPILNDYPSDFIKKFKLLSNHLFKEYSNFVKSISLDNINTKLNSNDYIYVYYACYHYSNKEVAELLNISESSVGKRYSIIYETLGLKSKQELVDYYNNRTKRISTII